MRAVAAPLMRGLRIANENYWSGFTECRAKGKAGRPRPRGAIQGRIEMNRIITLIALAVLLLAFAAGCDDDDNPVLPDLKYSSVDEFTFVVADNPFLRVETYVGGISVRTGPTDTIRVVVQIW